MSVILRARGALIEVASVVSGELGAAEAIGGRWRQQRADAEAVVVTEPLNVRTPSNAIGQLEEEVVVGAKPLGDWPLSEGFVADCRSQTERQT